MKKSVEKLLDRYYPVLESGKRYQDGTAPFYEWILESVENGPDAVVLNVGAGPTPEPHRRLSGKFRKLTGVDPDPVVLTNDDLDEAHVNDGICLPFADGQFDAVYSDWTVEHVASPLPFLREICRVLKPGGSFLFRTVNWRHYVTVISAGTPPWFHLLVANRVRALPKDNHDPTPTYYKLNTPETIRGLLTQAGFGGCTIRLIESYPSYLVFSSVLFRLGVAYERLVNKYKCLSKFRMIILCRATKEEDVGAVI